jgi:hypothetical protein
LRVLDIADPGNPREVAHYNTWDPDDTEFMSVYDGAWGIHVDRERNLVYILDSSAGLVILRMTV